MRSAPLKTSMPSLNSPRPRQRGGHKTIGHEFGTRGKVFNRIVWRRHQPAMVVTVSAIFRFGGMFGVVQNRLVCPQT